MLKRDYKSHVKSLHLILAVLLFAATALAESPAATNKIQDELGNKAFQLFLEGRMKEAKDLAERAIDEDSNPAKGHIVRGLALSFSSNPREGYLALNSWASDRDFDRKNMKLTFAPSILKRWADKNVGIVGEDCRSSTSNNEDDLRKDLREFGQPASAFDYMVRSFGYSFLGRTDNEIDDLTSVIRLNPGAAVAYFRRARIFRMEGKTDLALADLKKALGINPKFVEGLILRGDVYRDTKNADASLRDYSDAIAAAPNDPAVYFSRGSFYHRILDDRDLAFADYTKAIGLDPKFASAYANRAIIFSDKKDFDSATKDIDAANNHSYGGNFYYLYGSGILYSEKGNFEMATEQLRKAVQCKPQFGRAYGWLGNSLLYQKSPNNEEAFQVLSKAIELMPSDASAYSNRATALRNLGKLDESLADSTKSIQLNPKEATLYYNRGQTYFHDLTDFDKAIADYTKAIELNPNFFVAYLNRSDAYESAGRKDLAESDQKKLKQVAKITLDDPKKYRRTIYPSAKFDAQMAQAALSPGTATLTGKGCSAYSNLILGKGKKAAGVKIFLYPVTPYLQEWHNLRNKKENKTLSVFMSSEAAKYVITTTANEEGRFVFKNLKPGKYFLHAIHSFSTVDTYSVYVGSDVSRVGNSTITTEYYGDQKVVSGETQRLEKFVDITSDGKVEDVMLRNSWRSKDC